MIKELMNGFIESWQPWTEANSSMDVNYTELLWFQLSSYLPLFKHHSFREEKGQISLTDGEIRCRIMIYTYGREPHEIGSWAKTERDLMLRKLKEEGLSIRQIERVTGNSRGVVAKC
jgi:hypothetical protein